ncbi:MAG: ribosome biogenesis GTPase YqeH [Bacilli bacterium]|nr:ribosome biogenesis GTPase YqeH [Bacilli bacterium]
MKKTAGITDEIRIKRCYGCGAILQSTDPKKVGYIREDKMKEEEGLCERCYKLRHYNVAATPHFSEDYEKILAKARETLSLVVYVLDLFNFDSSLIDEIDKYLGDNVLVILNKRDVLPKSLSDENIKKSALLQLKQNHIKVKDIVITSSSSNYNLDELFNKINSLRNGKDVYFIGASQVGKSSIINAILRNYKNMTTKCITTSSFPGTTLDLIDIPLDENSSVFDTPGIFNSKSLLNRVERNILRYIVPRDEVKPKIYQSGDKQSYIFGALARLDFISGKKTNFAFYFSNEVIITRTKLDKADRTFDSLAQTNQVKPTSTLIKSMKDLVKKEIKLPATGHISIKIFGFGFIELEANNQILEVYVPQNVGLKVIATN